MYITMTPLKNAFVPVLLSGLLAIGCAGTPQKNPLLVEAQNNFEQTEKDSMIVMKAPVALKEAGKSFKKAINFGRRGEMKCSSGTIPISPKQKVAIARGNSRA